jgi:hypothetical protein
MRFPRMLLSTALVATVGCYSYVPTTLDEVRPGAAVRLRISALEAERLEPIRFTDSRALEGALAHWLGDEIYVDAIVRSVDAYGYTAMHTQRLNIPALEVQSLEYRRLDVLKTGLAVGGLAFVLGAAAYAVLFGDLGSIDRYDPVDEMRPAPPRLQLPLRFAR